jgi:type VI secretion system secreted protein VgrG
MPSNDNIVRAKIELEDGKEINYFYELNIHQKVSDHHTFELRCPLNALESDSEPLINHSKDLFGKLIKVGFASGGEEHPAEYFFKGIITNLSVDKYQGIGGDLLISGYSPTILLEEGRKYGTFDGKSLSENVRQIMQEIPSNLLEAQSDPDTDTNVGYRVQYKESSFQYLLHLAQAYNQWLYFDGTKLYFGKKKDDDSLDLHFGSDVTSMKMEYKLSPSSFQLFNYNPQSDKLLTGDSANANGSKLDDISDMLQSKSESIFNKKKQMTMAFHPEQQSDMDGLASVIKNRLGSQYLSLSGKCNNPHIKIGSLIKITGPNRANPSQNDDYGKYRVVALEQTVDGGGSYSSTFEAISATAATPLYDSEPSYMPVEDEFAKVMDNKDPEKMGRVKVQHVWQKDDEQTHWLDASQMYAGYQRGFYFVPEIGDMVMIGYINGNPSYPYVKGSMYRKDNKPLNVYEDDNTSKAIALSQNMYIQFDTGYNIGGSDTEIIGITSFDGSSHPNYVLITKDAEYGVVLHSENHKILIDADTIKIESKNEMEIIAGQDLTVTAGGKLTIDAGSNDIELKGMNIKLTATQKVSMSGQLAEISADAQAKLSGNAIVEITAGLIKLN